MYTKLLLDVYLLEHLLKKKISMCLALANEVMFSIAVVPFSTTIGSAWKFQLLYTHTNTEMLRLFHFHCFGGCMVLSHRGFSLNFPDY
jgi:hypothetical protein